MALGGIIEMPAKRLKEGDCFEFKLSVKGSKVGIWRIVKVSESYMIAEEFRRLKYRIENNHIPIRRYVDQARYKDYFENSWHRFSKEWRNYINGNDGVFIDHLENCPVKVPRKRIRGSLPIRVWE